MGIWSEGAKPTTWTNSKVFILLIYLKIFQLTSLSTWLDGIWSDYFLIFRLAIDYLTFWSQMRDIFISVLPQERWQSSFCFSTSDKFSTLFIKLTIFTLASRNFRWIFTNHHNRKWPSDTKSMKLEA